jgi:glycosyltransferase involved in cell wall biosynthesis
MSAGGLRLLMTTDAVGGVWTFSTGLANELALRGARILLVTMGPQPRAEQLSAIRSPSIELVVTDYALEWMDPEGRDAESAGEGLLRLAERFDPDLVHVNGFREAALPFDAPVLLTAHSCVWTWWKACRGGRPDEPRWSTYFTNAAAGLEAARLWIAPTHAFRAAIQEAYSPRSSRRVIRNGTTLSRGSAEKQPFILSAGRLWDEAKNTALLDAIAPSLPWPVKLAGADPRTGAEASACEILGPLAHEGLRALMEEAAVYAAPALYEPFGLSVLEAAASGCALVLADIATFRELWDGVALFCDPRDPEAFGSALRDLCADERRLRSLGAAARRRASHYTLTATAAAYLDAYESLLPGSARRSLSHFAAQPGFAT